MNANKSKMKLLATITIMLLFASAMLAVVPQAKAVSDVKLFVGGTSTVIGDVSPGDVITVEATAQYVGATLVGYFNETTPENRLGSVRLSGSSTTGRFNVTIPEVARGTYTIIVAEETTSGSSSNAATSSADFTVAPKITVTLDQDIVGALVTIRGTGFTPYTTGTGGTLNTVTFTFDGDPLTVSSSAVRPNANGVFSVTFRVPDRDYGTYLIEATGSYNSGYDFAAVDFAIGPVITLSPSTGGVGTEVTVRGRGYTPGETLKNIITNVGTIRLLNTSAVQIDNIGEFETTIMIQSGSGTREITAIGVGPLMEASATFGRVGNANSGSLTVNPIAGYPTTQAGPGDSITVTGSNFATIAGTKVTLTLTQAGAPEYALGDYYTSSDGTFTAEFTVPPRNAGEYNITARDEYGITGSTPFGISILHVGLYDTTTAALITYDLTTGMRTQIKGTGFDIFGSSYYTANITINDKIVPNGQNVGHSIVNNGLSAIIGAVGNTMEPGTYTVGITAYVNRPANTGDGPAVRGYIYAETEITVSKVAEVTVTPQVAPRNSTILVEGAYFTNATSVTIRILNATTGVQVGSAYTAPVGTSDSSGTFARNITLPIDFNLGDYIINATDSNRVTAITDLTVAKVSIDITLGANTYSQGDIATFQLTSNTAPTGTIKVYDSSGAIFTTISLATPNWVKNGDGYSYQQTPTGGVPFGVMLQIASDARTGAWTWTANIQDAKEPQEYSGAFTVTAKGTTPTQPPATSQPPTTTQPPATHTPTEAPPATQPPTQPPTETPPTQPPTETPSPPSGGIPWWVIALVVVALIIGVIAVFLVITMRQKIAN